MITKHPSSSKTIETTISDQYTVLLEILEQVSLLPIQGSILTISKNLTGLEGPEATSFFAARSKAENLTNPYICQ